MFFIDKSADIKQHNLPQNEIKNSKFANQMLRSETKPPTFGPTFDAEGIDAFQNNKVA